MKGMKKKLYGKSGGSRTGSAMSAVPPMKGSTAKVGPLRTTFVQAVGKR